MNADKYVGGRKEPSFTVSETINWFGLYGKKILKKMRDKTIISFSNSIPRYLSQEHKTINQEELMDTSIALHNSQDLETTQEPHNR